MQEDGRGVEKWGSAEVTFAIGAPESKTHFPIALATPTRTRALKPHPLYPGAPPVVHAPAPTAASSPIIRRTLVAQLASTPDP